MTPAVGGGGGGGGGGVVWAGAADAKGPKDPCTFPEGERAREQPGSGLPWAPSTAEWGAHVQLGGGQGGQVRWREAGLKSVEKG